MALRSWLCLAAVWSAMPALAETAPFDLAGPKIEAQVTHDGATLPISEVPNLAPGDRLWIKADLPADQSVHYLLVVAFLRGATNPPPRDWFYRDETWTQAGGGGIKVTTPEGAQQVLIFLAPSTSGDFGTLVDAVRGQPGAFVRASQDLNQASLDRSRLNVFLTALRRQDLADPDRLKAATPLLARSLSLKLDADCFRKMPELQAACLMQGQDALVLDDGHSTSIVEALTTGDPANLAMNLSATPQADYGAYSPYVGAVMDIARILDSLHVAHYRYIPALAVAEDDRLALVLNSPPSFHNPLSVLVTALPAVEPPQAPPLQAVDPKAAYCVERKTLVLPIDGAPLAYSTAYAHDMILTLKTRDGGATAIPVRADAALGGFVADLNGFDAARFGPVIDGGLRGRWGFESFEGPKFQLQNAQATPWRVAADDAASLVAGRSDKVAVEGADAACVESISLRLASGETQAVDWRATAANRLEVTLPLTSVSAGQATLLVKQYGVAAADETPLEVRAQAARFDGFSLYAGDASGELRGAALDEVAKLSFDGIDFTPGATTTTDGHDELAMESADPRAAKLETGRAGTARVTLKEGGTARVKVEVGAPRPRVTLIGLNAQPPPASDPVSITLTDAAELPRDAQLTFSIRAEAPTRFTGRESVEVSTLDGASETKLDAASGLIVEDGQVAVATVDLARTFGPSAFGPLRFRVVQNGTPGDWRGLATLVRTPKRLELKCRAAGECQLTGSNLFLIDEVASNRAFDHAVRVPQGFPGPAVVVPRPSDGRLYVKLRDAPDIINEVAVRRIDRATPLEPAS